MGQISIFTKEQKIIFDGITGNEFISRNFYFTGGTALSVFHLKHRYSDDLDFFTDHQFDTQPVFNLMNSLKNKYHFNFQTETIEKVNMYYLQFSNKKELKIDFNYYPYKRIEKGEVINGITIDSLLDIAVNKLLTINQRTDIKDFIDFYYLEPLFGIWDLIVGVKVKFQFELEPWLLSSDLLKIEDFTVLPRMIKPVSLPALKKFYRELAKKVAKKVVVK